ncbi:hypothetical protein CCO04_21405 [Pimelobacter sp. 30-1]|nr:hypothetical protein [Pimelobacter sp. 30-1]
MPRDRSEMGRRDCERPDLAPSLAMVLSRAFTPPAAGVSRDEVLRAALEVWAPAEILAAVQALPDARFDAPEDVMELLITGSERAE